MKHGCIGMPVFLTGLMIVSAVSAATLTISRPFGGEVPLSDNPPTIILEVEGAQLGAGAFSVFIDDMSAEFDAARDGIDNDGDGLIDESSENPVRRPEEHVSVFHGRWPWALRADDPLTPEDEGIHTLSVQVISRPDIELEENLTFSIKSTGGIDSLLVYPSPFNPRNGGLRIAFGLRTSGRLKVEVTDFYGKCLATVAPWHDRDAGWHDDVNVMWNGRTTDGELISNGVYFIRAVFKNQITSNEWIEKCFVSY